MSQQQQLLTQNLTVSQILRTSGKQFRQITERYSDGPNGRYAIGVIMSYFGPDGKCDSEMISSLLAHLPTLGNIGIYDDFFIIGRNYSDMTFDEGANYLDRTHNSRAFRYKSFI